MQALEIVLQECCDFDTCAKQPAATETSKNKLCQIHFPASYALGVPRVFLTALTELCVGNMCMNKDNISFDIKEIWRETHQEKKTE